LIEPDIYTDIKQYKNISQFKRHTGPRGL